MFLKFFTSVQEFKKLVGQNDIYSSVGLHIDGLVQERRNSNALAMELRRPCINPLKWPSIEQGSPNSPLSVIYSTPHPHGEVPLSINISIYMDLKCTSPSMSMMEGLQPF